MPGFSCLSQRFPYLLRLFAFSGLLVAGVAQADVYGDVSALTQAGKMEQAIEQADLYLQSNPRDPQMRFLKGVAQSQSGDMQAAITTFTQLTEEYPELPEPYNNLAVIHASQNELDKARNALEAAVRNNPDYAVAHENLGDIYARLAHDAWQRALKLQGGHRALQLKLTTLNELLQPVQPPAQH